MHANGKIQITSIHYLEDVDPCINQVVDLIEVAHKKSSASAPIIDKYDPTKRLVRIQVCVTFNFSESLSRAFVALRLHSTCRQVPHSCHQTELTVRLGFKLPFQVNYDRVQQLIYADRFFERPGPANLTVFETREPLASGAGPFFRCYHSTPCRCH